MRSACRTFIAVASFILVFALPFEAVRWAITGDPSSVIILVYLFICGWVTALWLAVYFYYTWRKPKVESTQLIIYQDVSVDNSDQT